MKLEEANKIIARYEGYEFLDEYNMFTHKTKTNIIVGVDPLWSDDLNMLVPVWEKMSFEGVWLNIKRHGVEGYHLALFSHSDNEFDYLTVKGSTQETACIVTAKAIKEIK